MESEEDVFSVDHQAEIQIWADNYTGLAYEALIKHISQTFNEIEHLLAQKEPSESAIYGAIARGIRLLSRQAQFINDPKFKDFFN